MRGCGWPPAIGPPAIGPAPPGAPGEPGPALVVAPPTGTVERRTRVPPLTGTGKPAELCTPPGPVTLAVTTAPDGRSTKLARPSASVRATRSTVALPSGGTITSVTSVPVTGLSLSPAITRTDTVRASSLLSASGCPIAAAGCARAGA